MKLRIKTEEIELEVENGTDFSLNEIQAIIKDTANKTNDIIKTKYEGK